MELDSKRVWLYAPGQNASQWNDCADNGIVVLGWPEMGNLSDYTSREALDSAFDNNYFDNETTGKNSKLCLWEFGHAMKEGDIIYAKRGVRKIIGRGIIVSEYIYDPSRTEYCHLHKVKWTHQGEWNVKNFSPQQLPQKTLTDMTQYQQWVAAAEKFFAEQGLTAEQTIDSSAEELPAYSKEDFLNEVFMSDDNYEQLHHLLLLKKNVILQGAPGVGKTFCAKRLAYSIMGKRDDARVKMVQFHQNYSYEDFIMGYKPSESGGFELQSGVFYDFCKKAAADRANTYFFIIDEINRGNLSKIFGELLMLIEKDYRDKPIQPAYRKEDFSVPANLYIIGMMNTADRSLAMIDYALRRRFSFFTMRPSFDSDGFKQEMQKHSDARLSKVINTVKQLNEEIAKDESLGEGFCIGHSYFCAQPSDTQWIENVVRYDLCPIVEEYWFDNTSKRQASINLLLNTLE